MKTASNILKNKQPLGATAYQEIYRKIITTVCDHIEIFKNRIIQHLAS
jgi:hypothetical protein